MGEAPRSVAAAAEPQQAAAATTVVMTTAVTALSISLAPAPVSGSQVAVVEVPDNDTPPPGWDQWGSLPAPAPEPQVGALVVRDDGPAGGAEASSSRTVLTASDGAAARPEQERERIITPPAHLADAQAE
jgi:hypothetical protein